MNPRHAASWVSLALIHQRLGQVNHFITWPCIFIQPLTTYSIIYCSVLCNFILTVHLFLDWWGAELLLIGNRGRSVELCGHAGLGRPWGSFFSHIISFSLFARSFLFSITLSFPSFLSLSVSLSPLYFSPSIYLFIHLPPSLYSLYIWYLFNFPLFLSLFSISLSLSIIPSFFHYIFSSHLSCHFFLYSHLLSSLLSNVFTPPLPSATILTLFCTLPNPIQSLHDATHPLSTDLPHYHMAILFYPILLIMHHWLICMCTGGLR